MKVVLFCGGMGMRLREAAEDVPKPLVPVGQRPILWNLMKYYAHYGHKDFILCLGRRSDYVKHYFFNYREYLTNDFVLKNGGREVELLGSDIHDWNLTFVDTGLRSCIGERLRRVKPYLEGEDVFLANYSDNLTDFDLPQLVDPFMASNNVASFLAIKPPHSFHVTSIGEDQQVESIVESRDADLWINGGYFALRSEIFEYLNRDEELVLEPFARLMQQKRLMAVKYGGFWQNMDTYKDKVQLDDMYSAGEAPWEIWKSSRDSNA